LLDKYEVKVEVFREEEKANIQRVKAEGGFAGIDEDWLSLVSDEVIQHYPPQLIVGKQTGEDKEYLVADEDPLVKVSLIEVACEYNYSNPTGWFNLSLPHIEVKTNNYTTMSYAQFKRMQFDHNKKIIKEAEDAAKKVDADSTQTSTDNDDGVPDLTDPQEPPVEQAAEIEED
jgi:hypothetical protein